jgi:predicted Fe-S protein YdhL (DUF1289 family)
MPDPEPTVASPCIGVCQLDPASVCTGCGRSIGEIAEWSTASPGRQRDIVTAARGRVVARESQAAGWIGGGSGRRP